MNTEQLKIGPEIRDVRAVYLGKKRVGKIVSGRSGYQYFPDGQKIGGDTFPSLVACLDSLKVPA